MKTNRSLILTGILLLLTQALFSQAICGFDAVHKRQLEQDPAYHKNVLDGEAAIRTYIRNNPKLGQPAKGPVVQNTPIAQNTPGIQNTRGVNGVPGSPSPLAGPPYTIPVVVHIIHTGGAVGTIYNPTDAQIIGAINYLNAVYNGTYAGSQGGDMQIQFALAQRDPNCNPTNGINRVDGSGVSGYTSGGVNASTSVGTAELNVKNLSRWDPTKYYNVWVVDKIDGNDGTSGQFIAGFAYFPGASASLDGIIMLATQMVTGQKTLPHEIGHAFNLYHPFEGSTLNTSCPPATNNNCLLDGDQVCDTDPITENINGSGVIDFSCRSTINGCVAGGTTNYSINTESNYMNYTNCYTLFTAGQKTRMLAAAAGTYRLSLTTSQGATAPNTGSSPCIPKIDFELTGDQQTETTAAATGCRAYKDYSYNMVIGNTPTAAATVTLAVSSGTAVQGVDFDFTTNGSFSAPGTTISFPAGSVTAHAFTIRVYDDASINGTRTTTLTFTVNSGGGNAVAGDGRPSFTMIINDNDIAPHGPAAATASIGTDQGGLLGPFRGANGAEKSQFLYYASELLAAGLRPGPINGIGLNIAKTSGAAFVYTGMTIKAALTTQTSLYVSGSIYPLADAAFSTALTANYSTVNGWNNFTFTTPFTWDGTSNLVFAICYDNGSTTGANDNIEGFADGSGKSNYIFAPVNCGTAIGGFSLYTGAKPQIRIVYPDPGDSVQTATSSRQQYLGPNTDVYFYSQSDNKLLARIQNMSAFDYGCTQILVDRTGTGATTFWNNSTANYLMNKTLKVNPTSNNTSGSYKITLYYTPAEISGWQTATGQSLSNIQLVKVASQVADVTPANPTGGGAVVIGTPTIGTLGVNTSLTYNFTTGFSGFGAGVPGTSTLPLGLLDFTGQLLHNNTLLAWTTSFEKGTRRFGIERSYDGVHYTNIGYIDAAGNSNTRCTYTYTDLSDAQPVNYYRLQQIDIDGKFTYSKIILVNNIGAIGGFSVAPSPFHSSLDILFGDIPVTRIVTRLLDMAGIEILHREDAPSGNRLHLDLSAATLSAGIYILEVRYNNAVQVIKLIHQ